MSVLSADSIDVTGSSILVTGGTGSFGQKFVKNLLKFHKARRIVVFSRDEQKHFDMGLDPDIAGRSEVRFFIGDVRDRDRLDMAMHGIDYVVHAAAMKHVPAAEYNPFECIHTNVLGAENVVNAALRNRVKKVVALSTDKASSPINLYGASKLASDKIFIAANNLSGGVGTRFSVVRYGNVIGSRGSVIPFFAKRLRDGATVLPITDPRMTRFWITLQHGVEFVLSSLSIMRGGEIFVPKIPSMRIIDLVETMAPGMKTEIVGIRPGEKLHESMISEDDGRLTLEIADRYIIEPAHHWWNRESYVSVGARSVPEGFCYASNLNDHWLAQDDLRQMIQAWL